MNLTLIAPGLCFRSVTQSSVRQTKRPWRVLGALEMMTMIAEEVTTRPAPATLRRAIKLTAAVAPAGPIAGDEDLPVWRGMRNGTVLGLLSWTVVGWVIWRLI